MKPVLPGTKKQVNANLHIRRWPAFRKGIMNTLQTISSTATKNSSYGFFFDRIDYCLSKGKAFTLFNAEEASIAGFLEQCDQRGFHPFTVKFSSIESIVSSI